jgi:hypothetical protein
VPIFHQIGVFPLGALFRSLQCHCAVPDNQ